MTTTTLMRALQVSGTTRAAMALARWADDIEFVLVPERRREVRRAKVGGCEATISRATSGAWRWAAINLAALRCEGMGEAEDEGAAKLAALVCVQRVVCGQEA